MRVLWIAYGAFDSCQHLRDISACRKSSHNIPLHLCGESRYCVQDIRWSLAVHQQRPRWSTSSDTWGRKGRIGNRQECRKALWQLSPALWMGCKARRSSEIRVEYLLEVTCLSADSILHSWIRQLPWGNLWSYRKTGYTHVSCMSYLISQKAGPSRRVNACKKTVGRCPSRCSHTIHLAKPKKHTYRDVRTRVHFRGLIGPIGTVRRRQPIKLRRLDPLVLGGLLTSGIVDSIKRTILRAPPRVVDTNLPLSFSAFDFATLSQCLRRPEQQPMRAIPGAERIGWKNPP